MVKDKLIELLKNKSARIGVIGLGYVGLPLVVEFALKGFHSTGFEVDERKVDEINAGRSYIPDVPSNNVKEMVEAKKLDATIDFGKLKECDAIIICVPTPLRKTKEPDMSYILAAAEKIQENIRSGQLIVLESTTYPGTTDEVLLPMFEEKGLKMDEDFLLAFSPERVDPGNPQFQTHNIPKVVGGCTDDSTEVAAMMYSQIVNDVHAVSSARVAEAAKLWENTFRAVNIGMANEMARLCYTLGIDTWEVIRAAATKPFGFMPFYPGPGIGGHCLIGNETVVVRSNDSLEQIKTLVEVFDEQKAIAEEHNFKIDGSDVIYKPQLEILSLDTETQLPQWKPASYLFKRQFVGSLVTVTTSDNRKITVTDKHPMLVSDESGEINEVFAKDLSIGDRLPIHHQPAPIAGGFVNTTINQEIDLLPFLPTELVKKIRVRITGDSWRSYREVLKKEFGAEAVYDFVRQDYLPLEKFLILEAKGVLNLPHQSLTLHTGRGPSATSFPVILKITPAFARLIGYYLAEGCSTKERERERVRFSFHRKETEFISDVISILESEFGVRCSLHHSRKDQVTHIRVGSSLFGWLLMDVLKCGRRSTEMRVPDELMNASLIHRQELLKGLVRGDGDVYVKVGTQTYKKNGREYTSHNATAEVGYFSSSPQLFRQVIYILQNMGFTPTFKRTKPHLQLKGYEQLSRVRGWLGEKGNKLETYFAEHRKTTSSRTFKQAGMLTTVPVKLIEIKTTEQPVDVYSIEVEDTHTFATSYGIYVHNCIPLDPHYLSWKARQHGFDSRFISLAEEVNSSMPQHVIRLLVHALNEERKAVNGSRILILGVAYKKDIDDMRESPALSIIDLLRVRKADVVYHDPFVPEVNFDDAHTIGHAEPLSSIPLTIDEVKAADCVIIVTEHTDIDYKMITDNAKLIVDTRNALGGDLRKESKAKIIRL